MDRKKKPNGLLISGLISALASLAIVAVAPSFAGDDSPPKDKPSQAQSGQAQSNQANAGSNEQPSETAAPDDSDTKGNDRKSGYEDNSSEPQETNHGKGSDRDGDADSDPATSTEDSHTPEPDASPTSDNRHPSGKDRSGESGGSGNQGKAESNPDDSKGPMRYEGVQGDDKPGGPGGTDLEDQDGNNGCGNDDDFDDDNNGWCGKPVRTKPVTIKPGDTNTKTCPDGSVMPANGKCEKPDEVGGEVITKPKPTCPDGSVMPEGGNCGESIPCPDGTVMNADGNCLEENPSTPEENPEVADEVLGEQLEKDKDKAVTLAKDKAEGPSVLGLRLSPALDKPVKVAGAVLPFTGGDVLVFLVLALVLFAGGALIMRTTGTKASQS